MTSEPTIESAGQDNLDQFGTLAPVAARVGAALSTDTMTLPTADPNAAIYREALDWCIAHSHSQRERGTMACRDCLQRALMGRLTEPVDQLPALVGVKDPTATYIDGLLAQGGIWTLASILAAVNDHRRTMGKGAYTETGCSARIRALRKAGRHINQRNLGDGGAEYWNADLVTA